MARTSKKEERGTLRGRSLSANKNCLADFLERVQENWARKRKIGKGGKDGPGDWYATR